MDHNQGAILRLIAADRANGAKILVIGDSMCDQYIHGRLDSCQEDCPKFVEESCVKVPGGAANAARQLANWNAAAYLVAITGFGGAANHVWPFAGEYNDDLCFPVGTVPVKTRHLVGDKHVWRHDSEQVDYGLDARDMAHCRKVALDFVRNVDQVSAQDWDGVLIADYDKGFLDQELVLGITEECRRKKIPVVVDAKRPLGFYGFGAVIQCNSAYLSCQYNAPWTMLPTLVVTHGAQPPIVGRKILPWRSPVNVKNHVGAGDCFAAHLVLGLAHGLSLEEAADVANSAGRVYVQHQHGRAPYPHEVKRDILGPGAGGKTLEQDKVVALRNSLMGKKLVFTNGIFRLPHAGHAWFLAWARAQGDVLVVGINDDESAAALRPSGDFVMPLGERAEILAGMSAVDWIVPFAESTPESLIQALGPDLLVKGYEYAGQKVPGDDMVQEVRFAPPGPHYKRHATDLVQIIKRG